MSIVETMGKTTIIAMVSFFLAMTIGILFLENSFIVIGFLFVCGCIFLFLKSAKYLFLTLVAIIVCIPWQAPSEMGWSLLSAEMFGIKVPYIDAIIIFVMLLLLIKASIKNPGGFHILPIYWLYIFFAAVMLVSSIISIDPYASVWFLFFRIIVPSFGAFTISYLIIDDEKSIIPILRIIFIMGVIIAVYSIIEYFIKSNPVDNYFSKYFPIQDDWIVYYMKRLQYYRSRGTFGSPTLLGSFLIPIICLNIMFMNFTKRMEERLMLVILMLINIFASICAGSRGSIIGILVAVSVYILFSKIEDKKQIMLSIVSMIVVAILLLAYYGLESTRERFFVSGVANTVPYQHRVNAYRLIAEFFNNAPFMGIGINNFQGYNISMGGTFTKNPTTDNTFLLLIISGGIIGFSTYMYLLINIFKMINVSVQRGKATNIYLVNLAIMSSLIGMLISFIFYEAIGYIAISFIFWAIAGIGVGIYTKVYRKQEIK